MQFLQDQQGAAKIKDNKIVVRRDWSEARARLVGAFALARDLAQLAKPGGGAAPGPAAAKAPAPDPAPKSAPKSASRPAPKPAPARK